MGLFDRFRSQQKQPRINYAPGTGLVYPAEKAPHELIGAYGNVGWLYGIVFKIAIGISEAKWRLYKGSDRSERSQVSEHPLLKLLDFVNPFYTGIDFAMLSQTYMELAGEVFWVLSFNALGEPAEIWWASPSRMKVIPDRKKFIKGYVYQSGQEEIPLSTREVIHFKYPNPRNPYRGLGPAQAVAVDIDSEEYSRKWNRAFFYNSARPDLVMLPEGTLSEEEYERLKEQWSQRHEGVNKAHRVGIAEGIKDIKLLSIVQKDMDFKELRKLTREDLLGVFGMPLSVMGISENVNRANAEAGEYVFARWIVKPRLSLIRAKLNEQLLPLFRNVQGYEIDFDEVVPKTIEQKRDSADSGIKSGYMTINEARQLVGLDPIPKGDMLLTPLNLMPTPTKEAPQEAFLMPKFFKTEEQKEAFWKAYAAKTEGQEKRLIETLNTLWREQEETALANLRNVDDADEPLFDIDEANDSFTKSLKPHIAETYRQAVEDADALINPEPAHRSKQIDEEAEKWIAERALWLVGNINDTTREAIRAQLADAFAEGESIPKMERRVRSVFEDCSRRRATVIARTEIIAASNQGALKGYKDSDVVQKVKFYAALDERTCEECMAYHEIEMAFSEADGLIPVHPQCRCTFLPVV